MTFLSRQALSQALEAGILCDANNQIINDQEYIYENSILLKVGNEAYTTTDPECKDRSLVNLSDKQIFNIESGQFAILISNEVISIPDNMMGLISLNTNYKFKGLINVSGFHVNPGWKGRLIFTVYNAGPHTIPIRFKENAFRLWLSIVKDISDKIIIDREKKSKQSHIDSDKIYSLDGDIYSPHVLIKRVASIESGRSNAIKYALTTFIIGLLIGLGTNIISTFVKSYTEDTKYYLKNELKAEIKDEIVDEAIKQIQEHTHYEKNGPDAEKTKKTDKQDSNHGVNENKRK